MKSSSNSDFVVGRQQGNTHSRSPHCPVVRFTVRMKTITVFALLLCFLHSVYGDFCPNHKDKCPSSTTCCILNDGSYGCCPYKNAQCCSDNIHCCPSGTKCNAKRQSCDSSSSGFPYRWMVPLYDHQLVTKGLGRPTLNEQDEGVPIDLVKCPDGNECPVRNTCCQMPLGNYGCCPYPSANCCTDREHCCPQEFNCDMRHNRCVKKISSRNGFPFFKLEELPIFSLTSDTYKAPNTPSPCPTFTECNLRGGYSCCTDGESSICCPPGTVCEQGKNVCLEKRNNLYTNPLDVFGIDEQTLTDSLNIICPDENEACLSSYTCCQMLSGKYGCCPMPEAACCPDKKHCCPNGYVCGKADCERKPSLSLLHRPVFANWSQIASRRP